MALPEDFLWLPAPCSGKTAEITTSFELVDVQI
jgi:hypothetical protein